MLRAGHPAYVLCKTYLTSTSQWPCKFLTPFHRQEMPCDSPGAEPRYETWSEYPLLPVCDITSHHIASRVSAFPGELFSTSSRTIPGASGPSSISWMYTPQYWVPQRFHRLVQPSTGDECIFPVAQAHVSPSAGKDRATLNSVLPWRLSVDPRSTLPEKGRGIGPDFQVERVPTHLYFVWSSTATVWTDWLSSVQSLSRV